MIMMQPYFAKTDKMGNMHISMNSNIKGYTKAASNATTKSFLKSLVKGPELPISGTNSSVKISAVSSAFIGLDYYNNLHKENAGRALTHTAATTAMTAIGVSSLEAGIGGLAVAYGTEASMAVASSLALGTTPVGWSIAAGIGVGLVVDYAYDHNFLGIKDIANDMGDRLNKGIKNVGNAIDSDFKSIQKVFGW